MKNINKFTLCAATAVLALGISGAHAEDAGLSVGTDVTIGAETNAGTTAENNAEAKADAETNASTTAESNAEAKADAETSAAADFKAYDENSDGIVTKNEFAGSVDADTSAETFSELDTDGNGSLSKSELSAMANLDAAVTSTTKTMMQ